jgi:hypothetical protein
VQPLQLFLVRQLAASDASPLGRELALHAACALAAVRGAGAGACRAVAGAAMQLLLEGARRRCTALVSLVHHSQPPHTNRCWGGGSAEAAVRARCAAAVGALFAALGGGSSGSAGADVGAGAGAGGHEAAPKKASAGAGPAQLAVLRVLPPPEQMWGGSDDASADGSRAAPGGAEAEAQAWAALQLLRHAPLGGLPAAMRAALAAKMLQPALQAVERFCDGRAGAEGVGGRGGGLASADMLRMQVRAGAALRTGATDCSRRAARVLRIVLRMCSHEARGLDAHAPEAH